MLVISYATKVDYLFCLCKLFLQNFRINLSFLAKIHFVRFVAVLMSIVRCCQIAIEFDYALLYMTQISVLEKTVEDSDFVNLLHYAVGKYLRH